MEGYHRFSLRRPLVMTGSSKAIMFCLGALVSIVILLAIQIFTLHLPIPTSPSELIASSQTFSPSHRHPLISMNETESNGNEDRIKIGIVTCVGPTTQHPRTSKVANRTLTMVKSLLVSCLLNNVTELEIHVYTDSKILEDFLARVFLQFNKELGGKVTIYSHFYCVFRAVQHPNLIKAFVMSELFCTYVRLFFPYSLDKRVGKIIYMDTDMVFTGNIQTLWDMFKGEMVEGQHVMAAVRNNEASDTFHKYIDDASFRDIPFVPPKGVNAGLLLMDLNGLRKMNWLVGEVVGEFKKFGPKTFLNDQRLLNIIFSKYPEKLKVIPCTFNFQHLHCEQGLTCTDALDDPVGLQIMHGAGGMFDNVNSSHRHIYVAYAGFNLAKNQDNIIDTLLKPVRNFYLQDLGQRTCNGTLGKILYKNLLPVQQQQSRDLPQRLTEFRPRPATPTQSHQVSPEI